MGSISTRTVFFRKSPYFLDYTSLDVYGPLLSALKAFEPRRWRIVPLAYDWRLDLMEAVGEIERTVRELRLAAASYLRYGEQNPKQAVENWQGAVQADAVVLTGVLYRGSLIVFCNMLLGRRVGLNTALLHLKRSPHFLRVITCFPRL